MRNNSDICFKTEQNREQNRDMDRSGLAMVNEFGGQVITIWKFIISFTLAFLHV
jgi:hypothetical protein